jgi:riboflavin kinase/FMN adenylyltransferase
MPHHRSLDDIHLENTWLAVGVFDGVHRGHRQLLRRLADGAHASGAAAVVLTFDPHPAAFLGGRAGFACLTPPEEKAALLASLGVDHVITIPFDESLANQSAAAFMSRVAPGLGLRRLIAGHDFALGRGREGNVARLAELGRGLGYEVEICEAVREGKGPISSTIIREHIRRGEVAAAAALLGRDYAVSGPVVHGDGRGRHINVPTANVACPDGKLLPAPGVYAAWGRISGEVWPAATNIGTHPTFTPERQDTSLEAHLLGYRGDLYGREMRLEFVDRLRGERKFASAEALLAQIHADLDQTRRALEKRGAGQASASQP